MKKITLFVLLLFILAACQKGTPTQPATTSDLTVTVSPTDALTLPSTAISTVTPTPGPTATQDARLPPERWQEWPVVPEVTGRAIEIYRQGLALGNDLHAFSKVGDCQSVKAAFIGFLDIPERIPDTPEYQALQETIDQFAGYFNTDGQAVKGGFNAATVLSPLWANPDVCLAGENPLECELRITKPIIVFVSFEVWWEGRTAEQYERYMRQIIDTVIAHGSVPILATKADNVEGDHSINLTTARLAHEYDLPLFNFWLAVQPLPYHGLDPERDDGFHISMTDGWSVHSFTGLQTLDRIWQSLRDQAAAGATLPTSTPAPVASEGLLSIPDGAPTLAESGEQVAFGYAIREGSSYQPQGVILYDFDTEASARLLGTGWDFQAASPDGKILLVNLRGELYQTDGLTLTLVSSEFYSSGNQGALFLEDGSIVFVLKQGSGTALALTQADSSGQTILTQASDAPIELYPSTDGVQIAWESGSCSGTRVCERQGAWLTNLETRQSRFLTGLGHPLIAPDGAAMAYVYPSGENRTNLGFATADGIPIGTFPLYGDILENYAWEPGGGWLAVHLALRSSTSGQVTDGANYLVDPETYETRSLPSVLMLNPQLLWSQDGSTMAWLGTDWLTDQYRVRLFRVDVESGETTNLTTSLGLGDVRYLFVTNGAWLAKP